MKLALVSGLAGFLTSYGSVLAAQTGDQDLLTGGWSGQRVRMRDAGVDINLNYVGELMHNTRAPCANITGNTYPINLEYRGRSYHAQQKAKN